LDGSLILKMAYKFVKVEQVRKECNKDQFRVSKKFYEALDAAVVDLMKKAQERALNSRRRTLLGQDV